MAFFSDQLGPRQFLQIARARALEQQVPVLLAANYGPTGAIDADGKIDQVLAPFAQGALDLTVHPQSAATLYARYGDLLLYMLQGLGVTLCGGHLPRETQAIFRARRGVAAHMRHLCLFRHVSVSFRAVLPIRLLIGDRRWKVKKPATIRRSIATIGRAHQAAELSNPCESEPVRLALRELGRTTAARQRQALALGWEQIKEFLENEWQLARASGTSAPVCGL